ncbi:MAG: glycoside hydrolase family 2 protein [Acidobacteriota bacterium]
MANRFLLLLAAACLLSGAERASIDLNGTWHFRTGEEWRSIQVPGAWQAQGVGEPNGILRHHYAGAAWYRRTVAIPAGWQGRRIVLRIGGALRDVELSVNGTVVGWHSGMSAPFEFDVTAAARPGEDNVFLLRVSIPEGTPDTVSPDKQAGAEPTGMLNYIGNWGGLYGNVSLEASAPDSIDEIAIAPDVAASGARFRVTVRGAAAGTVRVAVGKFETTAPVADGRAEAELKMPGARLWTPEDPFLYTAEIALVVNGTERDRIRQRFGLREVATRGNVLLLNGKPLYLRGFGDDNIEVLTGTPPASKAVYLERLRLAKSYGFNAVRFHSMTPAPEYFEAADEVGIFVMAELPAAYTMYFLPHKEFLRGELEGILRAHRNHPSFLSLAFGNELNPEWIKSDAERKQFHATVEEFYRTAKAIDAARLIMATDGTPLRPTDMMSLYGEPPGDVPTVRHEFGEYYCSLPDVSLIDKFTGVVDPVWLKAKKRWVEENGLQAVYPAYLRNSERLQQLGRKFQIERVRLDNRITGYHYWLIVDYPGGTGEGDSWEEGWFDYFWRPKGVKPEEGRELNSAVLPLIDAGPGDRSMWSDRGKTIGVLVSNYGQDEIRNGTVAWRLTSGGSVLRGSELQGVNVPLGKVARVGEIEIRDLPGDGARRLELAVEVRAGGAVYTNRWDFWSFPRRGLLEKAARPVASTIKWDAIGRLYPFVSARTREWDPQGVVIASALSPELNAYLEAGGTVLLLGGGKGPELTYFPGPGAAVGTRAADHPALAGFPHEEFCGLEFYNLMQGSRAVPLDEIGKGAEPIVGAVMTASGWLSAKKDLVRVAQLYEKRVGRGRLLATTLSVRENFDEAYPEVIYFFDRLLRYALSNEAAKL